MANQAFGVGTYTWDWPVGVTQVTAECLGGGGFGGVARGNPSTGGGGKGGSYAKKLITKGVESSLTIDVGRGGSRVVNTGNVITALSSLPSTITQNGSIVCSAAGGSGGFDAVNQDENGAGGAALQGSNIGDVVFVGGNGSLGTYAGVFKSGAGGGSAGSATNGGAGGNQTGVAGLAGTGAFLNGTTYAQAGGAGVGSSDSGAPGSAPPLSGGGGGGSGSLRIRFQGGPWDSGGPGKSGVVLLTWVFTDPTFDQNNFRFYKNTQHAAGQGFAAQNTNTIRPVGGITHIRFRMQATNVDGIGTAGDYYRIYRSVNGGAYTFAGHGNPLFPSGAWQNASQLGTGTGTFHPPFTDYTAAPAPVYQFPGPGGYTEYSFAPLVPSGLAIGDTVDHRIYKNDAPFPIYTRTPRITVTGPLVLTQTTYRFYLNNATAENNATPMGGLDKNIIVDERTGNQQVTLRLQLQETSGTGMGTHNDMYGFRFSKNGGPYVTDVDYITTATPTNLLADTPTTNLLGSGSGTFVPGAVMPNYGHEFFGLGGYTEMMYGLFIYADKNLPGETIDIQMTINGVAITASGIPRITIYAQPQQKIISTMQAIPRSRFY